MTGKNIFNRPHFPKMINGGKADKGLKPTTRTLEDFETYGEAISYLLEIVENAHVLSQKSTDGTIEMLKTVAGAEKKIANMRDTMVETVAQFGQMVNVLEAERSAMWTLILQLLHRVDYLEKKGGHYHTRNDRRRIRRAILGRAKREHCRGRGLSKRDFRHNGSYS